MGTSVSAVKRTARDRDAEDEKRANDALNALMEIAQKNLLLFKTRVKNNSDATQIPIDRVVLDTSVIECNVSSGSDTAGIKLRISSILRSFANGEYLDGITAVVSGGIDMVLGNFSANSSEETYYLISVGTLGGFFRIDYLFYAYEFTSQSMSGIANNVLCVATIVSSVKTEVLNENLVRVILQQAYGGEVSDEELFKMQADAFHSLGFPVRDRTEAMTFASPSMIRDAEEKDADTNAAILARAVKPDGELQPLYCGDAPIPSEIFEPAKTILIRSNNGVFVWSADRTGESVMNAYQIGMATYPGRKICRVEPDCEPTAFLELLG